MKCPVCKDHSLYTVTLEGDLPAYQCHKCSGIWISSNPYMAWLEKRNSTHLPVQKQDLDIPVWDTQDLKLCADCGRIMSRFQVLPNSRFCLDRCGNCNGVWCDKNEWAVLTAHNLFDKLHELFTQPWQARMHEEEAKITLEKLYCDKFGEADYIRIKGIREWLHTHTQQSMLLAYLQAENPYKF